MQWRSSLKRSVKESNFRNAIGELGVAVQQLEDIKTMYCQPLGLHSEENAINKGLSYISKAIAQLNKRLEISKFLNEKKKR